MPGKVADTTLDFLRRGGMYQLALSDMREDGRIPQFPVHHEYPKWLQLDPPVMVHDEEEEERVLSGGKTSAQLEEEREGLLSRARNLGIKADPAWSIVRLRRELGEKMDAPPEAEDRLGRLEAELAYERKIAAMEAEIAELKARRGAGDDIDGLREELESRGIHVDGRWSAKRMRDELERAQAA